MLLRSIVALLAMTLVGSSLNAQEQGQSTLSVRADQGKSTQKNSNGKQGNPKNGQPESAKPPAVKPGNAKPAPVSKARIGELFAFVEEHHPEIRPLLRSLQKNRPIQFQTAMRTLDRQVRTIQPLKERAPERYERSLQQWITLSKTKLIAARIAVKKPGKETEKLQQQMNSLLNQHFNLRAEQIQADLAASKKRTERLQKQLQELRSTRSEQIKKQADALTRDAKRINADRKNQKPKTGSPANKAGGNPANAKSGSGK